MGGGSSEEWKGYQHQLLSDKKQRGYLVPDSAEKGTTPILRNLRAKEDFVGFLIDDQKNEMDTAWKLFAGSYKKHPKNDYIGYRPWIDEKDPKKRGKYQWLGYKVFGDMAIHWGASLRALEIPSKSNIGIFALNRPEWLICHMGNQSQSYRTTALYDTLGPDAVSYIMHHAEVPVIVTEKSKLSTLFNAIGSVKEKCDDQKNADFTDFALKYVVQMDYNKLYGNTHENVSDDDKKIAEELGIQLIGLGEMLANGLKSVDEFYLESSLPKKEDVSYIMYTSGTTGNPKGVILTHGAFAATTAAVSRECCPSPNDIHLSYLPLAHIFEAAMQAFLSAQAAKCAFFQGDIRKIGEDWKEIRPTILLGVPRVFNKTYEKFKLKISGFGSVKKWLLETAQATSSKKVRQGKRNSFYDKTIWAPVAQEIGFDRVRLTVSGGAPLDPTIAEFLRIILPDSSVQQGYGLTEVCAAASLTDPDDMALGHVGSPTDVCEMRLVDAVECNYLTTDEPYPRGEVEIRGMNMMTGYYKNDEATKKVLNAETGWFSTGDIGRMNPNGTISIIDRRKNLFKTSTGEYIASEKVEIQYGRASCVGQIWVYGNSFKSFIVAVVVPDAQVLVMKLKANKLWSDKDDALRVASDEFNKKFAEICTANADIVKKLIMEDMQSCAGGLHKFERIRDIHLEFELDNLLQGFNVDNGLLTPTFKLKRPQLARKYIESIKGLYTTNGEPPTDSEHWIN